MGEGSKPLFSAPGPKFVLRGQIRWSLVEAPNHDFHLIIGYRKGTTSACCAVASACVSVCKTRFLFECSARPNRKCGERSTTCLAAICTMANAHPDRIAFNPKLDAATNATAGSEWHDDTVVHDRPPFHINERFACMFHLQCHRACARVIPASGHEFGIRIIDRNRSRACESATNPGDLAAW